MVARAYRAAAMTWKVLHYLTRVEGVLERLSFYEAPLLKRHPEHDIHTEVGHAPESTLDAPVALLRHTLTPPCMTRRKAYGER
jgi:hypothetical protein